MDILDDMGVSKLSAKVFLKVNYSFKVGMKSNLTNLLFICNIVVFIINDLSVHFNIFLKFMYP